MRVAYFPYGVRLTGLTTRNRSEKTLETDFITKKNYIVQNLSIKSLKASHKRLLKLSGCLLGTSWQAGSQIIPRMTRT